jgi:hypothetical protein
VPGLGENLSNGSERAAVAAFLAHIEVKAE